MDKNMTQKYYYSYCIFIYVCISCIGQKMRHEGEKGGKLFFGESYFNTSETKNRHFILKGKL